MEWLSYLLILLCPIMMILCMKGHGGKHKHHDETAIVKNLNKKIKYLQEENEMQREEIIFLLELVKKEKDS
jgi:cell division protein FtsB